MVAIYRPQQAPLTRQCLQSVREYIITNQLDPGDKLPSQQKWAEMLGVSILVVREAFQAAQALGLVDIQHGRGIFVRSLEEADLFALLTFSRPLERLTVEEVCEARAMLELAVLETCIARATPEAIQEMEECLQKLREKPFRAGSYSPEHKLFHQAMLEATGDRLLFDIGRLLLNTFWLLGDAGRITIVTEAAEGDMVEIHAAYLQAIKNRDLAHTRELVDQHLLGACSKHHLFPCAEAQETSPARREKTP